MPAPVGRRRRLHVTSHGRSQWGRLRDFRIAGHARVFIDQLEGVPEGLQLLGDLGGKAGIDGEGGDSTLGYHAVTVRRDA